MRCGRIAECQLAHVACFALSEPLEKEARPRAHGLLFRCDAVCQVPSQVGCPQKTKGSIVHGRCVLSSCVLEQTGSQPWRSRVLGLGQQAGMLLLHFPIRFVLTSQLSSAGVVSRHPRG